MKNLKTLLWLTMLAFLTVVDVDAQKPDWSVDGKKNFVSVSAVFYSPFSTQVDYVGFTGGPSISISRILGRKSEIGFSIYGGALGWNPSEVHSGDPSFISKTFSSSEKAKGFELQFELDYKRYATRNGRSFAPLGFYYRFGLSINSYSVTTPEFLGFENPTEVIASEKFKTVSPGLVFGLGRDFRINENLFMGFGARTNLFITEEPTFNFQIDYFDESVGTYNAYRNWLIADYTLRYLF